MEGTGTRGGGPAKHGEVHARDLLDGGAAAGPQPSARSNRALALPREEEEAIVAEEEEEEFIVTVAGSALGVRGSHATYDQQTAIWHQSRRLCSLVVERSLRTLCEAGKGPEFNPQRGQCRFALLLVPPGPTASIRSSLFPERWREHTYGDGRVRGLGARRGRQQGPLYFGWLSTD